MSKRKSLKRELFRRTLSRRVGRVFFAVSVVLLIGLGANLFRPAQTAAATSGAINFQARLEAPSGAVVADGWYNVEFKMYSASSGGSAQWTEDYTYNNGSGSCAGAPLGSGDCRVQVINGYLTANLGSITAFPNTINWDQQEWLTMNIGGTVTSGSYPSMGDGEMSPRLLLTAVPYAFRAGSLALLTGANTSTLGWAAQSSANSILLPNAGGTLCLQSSSACGFATGSGSAFIQGGNSFSAQAELGTNDSNKLALRTNNADRLILDTTGNLQFQQASTINNLAAATGTQLTIQGGAATSGTNVGGNLLLQGGAGASTGAPGSVIVKANTNDSTTAFQVQNAAGGNLFQVDSANSNITVNGNNSGIVQAWQTGSNTGYSAVDSTSTVIANGYIYSMGGYNSGGKNTVQYSRINASGSLGSPPGCANTWCTTTALPTNVVDGSAAYANGYIYVTAGDTDNTNGTSQSTVYYGKVNQDGTVSAWTTSANPITQARNGAQSIVYNGYLYVIGGLNTGGTDQSTVYYSKLNADGSNGTWSTEANALNTATDSASTAVANGYLYVMGGGSTVTATTQYAKLNTDGTTSTWSTTTAFPVARKGAGTAVVNGYIYATGGTNGSGTYYANTYFAPLNANGTIGAWSCQGSAGDCTGTTPVNSTALPATRAWFGETTMTTNGYLYTIGGTNASVANTVYYTSTSRIQVAGSLDLVGIGGQNLNEGNSGGALTAGNTDIVGTLQVQDQANFSQSLSVAGNLNVHGNALLGSAATQAFIGDVGWSGTGYSSGFASGSANATTTKYALLQKDDGTQTLLNAATGGSVNLRINNSGIAVFTASGEVLATGVLDASSAGATTAAAGTATGDKIALYGSAGTGYGFGIQASRLVAYVPSGAGLSVRQASGSGNASSGSDAVTLLASGVVNVTTGYEIGGAAASGNYLRGNGTNFVSNTIQAGDLPSLQGTYIANVPTSTPNNTITPGAASVVGLTVNATGGTSAVAAIFNQTNNTSPADTVQINDTSTGTQTNDLLIARSGAGTTTNLLNLTNTSGTATNGLTLTGTFNSLINAPSFSVNNAGNITAGTYNTTTLTGSALTFGTSGTATIQPAAAQALTVTAHATSTWSTDTGNLTLQTTAAAGQLTLDAGTSGSGTVNLANTNANALNIAGNNIAHTIHIGDGSTSTIQAITIGSTGSTSSVSIQGGTGTSINIGTGGIANTLQIGNTTGAVAQIINVGNNATASSTSTLNIGSGVGTSSVTLLSGSTNGVLVKSGASNNSTTAFQVQNAAGGNLFQVDSTNSNITVNGNNSGIVQAWQTGNNTSFSGRDSFGSVIANGYIYIIGGCSNDSTCSSGSDTATVQYAKLLANGNVGNWSTTTALPGNRDDFGISYFNGYIYVVGGSTSDQAANGQTSTYYGKVNQDGTINSWNTATNTLPACAASGCYSLSSLAYNGYLYAMGGLNTSGVNQSTVYYTKLNADGSPGTWTTSANALNNATSTQATAVANGYAYILSGAGSGAGSTVTQYAKLNIDGSTSAWASTGSSLPAVRNGSSATIINGYIYDIAGNSSTAANSVASTYFAPLNANGTIGAWSCQGSAGDCTGTTPVNGTALPAVRSFSGNSSLMANGYIYVIGGVNASNATQSTVYYTSTARLAFNGSLDLVGTNGQNLNEGNTGGALTAGNTDIVGTLQVQDQANFSQSLSVAGNLNIGGYGLFKNSSNSTTAFQVQNAAAASLLTGDTTNMRISIGSGGTSISQLYVAGSLPSAAVSSSAGNANQDVVLNGRYAYVAQFGNNKLAIYDVSNPASPSLIGSAFTLGGQPQGLAFAGHYVYAAEWSAKKLEVVDVSNPNAPSVVGNVALTNNGEAVTVQGRYAYVANDGGVDVIDISNPTNPIKLTNISINGGTAATAIFAAGRYVYAATKNSGTIAQLVAIDTTTNTAASTFTLSGTTSGSTALAGGTWGPRAVYVQGRYAYVANAGNKAIDVFDVSNPATGSGVAPTKTLSTGATYGPIGLSVQGRYLYVAQDAAATGPSQLATYDISTISTMSQVNTLSTGGSSALGSITVQGRYAYLADINSNALQIYDVGGSYIQQLEAGGTETGTLSVSTNETIGGNSAIAGSLQVGAGAQIQGNLSTNGNATFTSQTNSTTAFQVQNATSAPIFLVDTTSTAANGNQVNYLTYPGFESGSFSNAAAGWNISGTGTLSQNTNKLHTYNGLDSAQVAATSPNNPGLTTSSFVSAPPGSATYIVSFYAKVSSGTMASTAFTVTSTGGAGSCSPAAGITINANGFQRLYCSLAVGAGAMTAFTIAQSDSATRTYYIDAVQLQSNSFNGGTITAPTPYQTGAIQLRGVITNPVALINNGDSTSDFQIQNATASNTVLDADTLNGRIGIGTATPGRTLDLVVSNSTINAPPLRVQQLGSGDASLEFNTPAKSFIIGENSANNSNFTISSSTASGTTAVLGYNTVGASVGSAQNGAINCTKFTAGSTGTITSMLVNVSVIDNSPNNKFQLGIFNNNAGVPGTFIASSSAGTLTANSWNTVPLTAAVTSGTIYWLCYESNGVTSTNNQAKFDAGSAGQFYQATQSYGTWTTPSGGSTFATQVSLYTNVTTTATYNSFATSLFNLTDTGQALFQNSSNSTTAFQVQNAAAGNLLQVDTTNNAITLNGNNSGEVSAWSTGSALPANRETGGVATGNGYAYYVGGRNCASNACAVGNSVNTVYYAKINAGGTFGTWTATTVLPANLSGTRSVFANGFLYAIGGSTNGDGTSAVGTVYYARVNADGTVGSWNTNANSLATARGYGGIGIYDNYVYIVGGWNGAAAVNNVQYAKLNPDGTIGTWTNSANVLPAAMTSNAVTVANGYLYSVGGNTTSPPSTTVYYSQLTPNSGAPGAWTTDASHALPAGRDDGLLTTANGYMYYIGGYSTFNTAAVATVYYNKISSTGALTSGTWSTAANALTAAEGEASGFVANGYIYMIGGHNGGSVATTYYTSTSRIQIAGAVDLIGSGGQSLGNDGIGSSLTAGNTLISGNLNVTGSAIFGQGVSVGDSLNVNGNTAVQTTSTTAFQVQNVGNTQTLFQIDTTGNLRVIVGSGSAGDTNGVVLVLDNKSNAGDPTGVNGAMYYNSNTQTFRCYENGAWVSCIGGLRAAQTAVSTLSSASDTNFSTAGTGSAYTVPANDCVAGRVYRATSYGTYTNGTTATTATLKLKFGATTVGTSPAFTLTVSTTHQWSFEGQVTCIDSTHVEAQGHWIWFTATSTPVVAELLNTATVAQVNSGTQLLTLSSAVSQTTGAPSVTERQLVVEGLGP